jgi:hypothetical protein
MLQALLQTDPTEHCLCLGGRISITPQFQRQHDVLDRSQVREQLK